MWRRIGSSLTGFFVVIQLFRSLILYCPPEVRRFLHNISIRIKAFFNPYLGISINEFIGRNLKSHEAYNIVEAYLSATIAKSSKIRMLKAEMVRKTSKFILSMDEHETVTDEFNGVEIKWFSRMRHSNSSSSPEIDRRYYKLVFDKKYKDIVTEAYLEHVIRIGREMQARNRERRLYTNSHNNLNNLNKPFWSHTVFEHPATFDTLAMEPWKKHEIITDLETFAKSKDYYSRIGKPWKRGYLLYGPPGTGKSTMIAAMANLLDYDVYDLELTSVKDNSELRRLLIETRNKSIIVIEDIDCSLDLTGQRGKTENSKNKEGCDSKVTLSGLLNFIDGLWSACGGERLIVFTTNYVDELDPALTRRGRMDKHIELSYCTFEGFKVFARNYLKLEEENQPLFHKIKQLMMETNITPADVAENLIPKSPEEDADKCLRMLIQALEEAKSKQQQEALNVLDEELSPEAEISPIPVGLDKQQTHED